MSSTSSAEVHNPLSLRVTERGPCPACRGREVSPVIEIKNVPTNSCLMLDSAEEARAYPRGDIALTFCRSCGFIFNRAFDPLLTEYSQRYEPTQAFSPTFQRFHEGLAKRLVQDLKLNGKTIVEIGCGQGEFLHLICGLGGNTGIGFDPCLDERREDTVQKRADRVELIGRFFSEDSISGLTADMLVSKMTLEHIPAARRFADAVRIVAAQSAPGMRIFIQIPESERILRDCAFEDIYYEHCNYFTELSLAGLFARCGFAIEEIAREYEGQYLAIVGRFTGAQLKERDQEEIDDLSRLVEDFKSAFARKIQAWDEFVSSHARRGRRIVIWGSGSKGVSFLSAISRNDTISHVVDINPHRQGKFMVGTGHPIIGPRDLPAINPQTVIAMNRVYTQEIRDMLTSLSLAPELVAL
jgi:hypothetical protein